jgi:anti-sigma regulatory factor (Ser/Thr protein kinase)
VELVVTDDGHGMSPRPDSPGLGLGLPLIASLADKMEIRSPERGSGVAIWVRFALPPA